MMPSPPMQAPETEIAVLRSQMNTVIKGIDSIEAKLDKQAESLSNYVTQAEFKEFKQRWFLSHSMAAMAGGILTGVIVYYLTRG